MKTTKILASTVIALASVAAGSAFAADSDMPYPVMAPTHSTVTRAQVQAELAQAQKEGMSMSDDRDYPVIAHVDAPKTRAEVRAELFRAQKDGSIPAYHG